MADFTAHDPTVEDAAELNARLRPADRDEIIASHGPDTLNTVQQAVRSSTHGVTLRGLDGRMICIFGVMPVSMVGGVGSPWMLGTDGLGPLTRTLARVARRYFAEVAQVYPVLENYVDVRNTESVKLLKWLGCSFDEPAPYGAMGLPFMRFERRSG